MCIRDRGAYTQVRFSQRQGTVQAQALQGEVPAYEVEFFAAPQSREPFTLDCAWQNDRAEITLTFLQDAAVQGELEPDEGWCLSLIHIWMCIRDSYTGAGR